MEKPVYSDDDSISITSTAASVHDSDESFPVVKVLAERINNHRKEFLVEWEGYNLDRASWEPLANIEGDTITEWNDKKRRQKAGLEIAFDVDGWEVRQAELRMEKADRKRRRKKKRKLFSNRALQRVKEPVKSKVPDSESSDGAVEENEAEDNGGMRVKKTRAKKSPSKRLLKKGLARPLLRESTRSLQKESIARPPPRPLRDEALDDDLQPSSRRYTKTISRSSTEQTPPVTFESAEAISNAVPELPQPSRSSSPDQPLAKIHQKPAQEVHSMIKDDPKPTENVKSYDSRPSSSGGSDSQPQAEKEQSVTTPLESSIPKNTLKSNPDTSSDETASQPLVKQRPASLQDAAAGKEKGKGIIPKNVFQPQELPTFKRRGNLLENSIKAKKTKAYSNMRLMYKAEVQGRAVAEQAPNLEVVGGLYNPANPSSMQSLTPSTLRRTSSGMQQEEDILSQDKDVDMKDMFVPDHDAPPPSGSPPRYHGPPVCFFWDQNQRKPEASQPCQNGYMCKFLHEYRTGAPVADDPAFKEFNLQNHSPTKPAAPQPSSAPGLLTCFYWDRYERDKTSYSPTFSPCTRGSSCSYLHEYRLGVPIAPEPPSKAGSANSIAPQPPSRENSLFIDEHFTESPRAVTTPPWRLKDSFSDSSSTAVPPTGLISAPQKKESADGSIELQSVAPMQPAAQLQSPSQLQPPQPKSSQRPEWDPNFPSRAICYFWFTNGHCIKGNGCKFAHSDISDLPIAPEPRKIESSDPSQRAPTEPTTQPQPKPQSQPTQPKSSQRPEWDPKFPVHAICYFWYTNGNCLRGGSCKYVHAETSTLPIAPSPGEQDEIRKNSNIVCKFWAHGTCSDGAHCRYAHEELNTSKSSQETQDSVTQNNHVARNPQSLSSSSSLAPTVTKTPSEPLDGGRKSVKFVVDNQPTPPTAPRAYEKKSDDRSLPSENNRNLSKDICRFWLRNECTHGSNCWFRHEDAAQNQNPYPAEFEARSLPEPRSKGDAQIPDLPATNPSSSSKVSNPPTGPSNNKQALDTPLISAQVGSTNPLNGTTVSSQTPKYTKINLENYRRNKMTPTSGTSSKEVFFGLEEAGSVILSFGGAATTTPNNDPWSKSFLSLTKIVFNQLCLPQDFEFHRQTTADAGLWMGNISAVDEKDTEILGRIADELSTSSNGLLAAFGAYSILVYPTRRDSWKFLESSAPECPADISLRYFIFSMSIPQLPQNSSVPLGTGYRKLLVNKVNGLEFEQLLPMDPRLKGKSYGYKFYLTFPEHASKIADFLASWIRSCEPKSIIYSSQIEGSWDSFIKSRIPGVVLVHNSVEADLYRLPHLSVSFLQDRLGKTVSNCVFWRVSEQNVLPSDFSSLNGHLDQKICQLSSTRLFPHGCAFFLTPSLLVADPEYTLKLLDWFLFDASKSKFESSASPWKLVTCYDVLTYTLAIANVKAKQKTMWEAHNKDDPAVESHLEERGLSYKTCETRFKLHTKLVDALDKLNLELSTNNLEDNPESPIVYAPPGIEPDDEAQLVDWFAGWAMLQVDTYKKFIVVGTGQKTNQAHLRRLREVKKKREPTLTNKPKAVAQVQPSTKPTAQDSTLREKAFTSTSKYSPQKPKLKPLAINTNISDAADKASSFLDRLGEELSPPGSGQTEVDENTKPSSPGIIADQNGDQLAPFSARGDKSTRKELRIKTGYSPREDQETNRHSNRNANSISRSANSSAAPSPTTKPTFQGGGDQMDLDAANSPMSMSDTSESKRQTNHTLQENESYETSFKMHHFQPTTVWYKQLQEKGGGWEHILVADTDTAALALGAPRP